MSLQVALSVQGSHATRGSRCDGLTIDLVLNVAGSKDALDRGGGQGERIFARHDVAVIQCQLVAKDGGVGGVTDCDENAINSKSLVGFARRAL